MKDFTVTSWSAVKCCEVVTLFNLEGTRPEARTRPGRFGGLAQLGERLPCKQEVSGSIPLISTRRGPVAQLARACD